MEAPEQHQRPADDHEKHAENEEQAPHISHY